MKKAIAYFFLMLIIICFASMFLVGCKATKTVVASDNKILVANSTNDSIKTIVINQPINDKLITPVVQSNTGNQKIDSIVNAKVDEILQKLNTNKQSGTNGYSLLYDKLKKQLEFIANINQTKNENTATEKTKTTTIFETKEVPVIVEKPLQRWQLYLIYFGVASGVFFGFKAFQFIRTKIV